MLKHITLGILSLMLIAQAGTAYAQQDPEARRILDAMSNKYRSINSFSADLKQNLSNSSAGINEEIAGTIAVKGDMYRIDLGAQEIANDGEKVYVYLEEINEITVDFYYPEDNDLSPTKIFDLYKSGYKYTKLPDETVNGKACHIIDLIPESGSDSQFYRIRLAVDKSNLMLQSYTMYDRSNTAYTYVLTNVELNANLPDSKFKLGTNTHPEATVVDLTN